MTLFDLPEARDHPPDAVCGTCGHMFVLHEDFAVNGAVVADCRGCIDNRVRQYSWALSPHPFALATLAGGARGKAEEQEAYERALREGGDHEC